MVDSGVTAGMPRLVPLVRRLGFGVPLGVPAGELVVDARSTLCSRSSFFSESLRGCWASASAYLREVCVERRRFDVRDVRERDGRNVAGRGRAVAGASLRGGVGEHA